MTALEPISLAESKRLKELEAVIKEGKDAWLEVGLALTEIRDKKLYRSEFDTFKAYCVETWGWTDKRAYQLIYAADETSTSGRTFENEKEARKARSERIQATKAPLKVASEPTCTPAPTESRDDEDFRNGISTLNQLNEKQREPLVTEYYHRLESLVSDALENATDKQLVSMSVYAATIPKVIKAALALRKSK